MLISFSFWHSFFTGTSFTPRVTLRVVACLEFLPSVKHTFIHVECSFMKMVKCSELPWLHEIGFDFPLSVKLFFSDAYISVWTQKTHKTQMFHRQNTLLGVDAMASETIGCKVISNFARRSSFGKAGSRALKISVTHVRAFSLTREPSTWLIL